MLLDMVDLDHHLLNLAVAVFLAVEENRTAGVSDAVALLDELGELAHLLVVASDQLDEAEDGRLLQVLEELEGGVGTGQLVRKRP